METSAQTKTQQHTQHHNSLQHDPAVSLPLLSILVDALKKENKVDSEEKEGLEIIAEEANEDDGESAEKKRIAKDAIVELANRIKHLYAQEMLHEAYGKSLQKYNPNAHYQNEQRIEVPNMLVLSGEQEEYSNPEKRKPKKMADENSNYNKLAGGIGYQPFIMTDPRGRLHGRWESERIMNENYDGKLERNDGLHGQWL